MGAIHRATTLIGRTRFTRQYEALPWNDVTTGPRRIIADQGRKTALKEVAAVLPALTSRPSWVPGRRVLLATLSALLSVAAVATQLATTAPTPTVRSLADELRPATWAMHVPMAWLAAPVPSVRRGDQLDILAVRQGDRAYTVPVGYAVAVLSSDERGLVLEVDENDANAIATARGGGLLLVPLLRSSR